MPLCLTRRDSVEHMRTNRASTCTRTNEARPLSLHDLHEAVHAQSAWIGAGVGQMIIARSDMSTVYFYVPPRPLLAIRFSVAVACLPCMLHDIIVHVHGYGNGRYDKMRHLSK